MTMRKFTFAILTVGICWFAAYAAHGVVPIVLSDKSRQDSFDGLRPAEHFLDGLSLATAVGVDDLASIQCKLLTWYTPHCVKAQAEFLLNSITACVQLTTPIVT